METTTQETTTEDRRELAIKRIREKSDFKTHLIVYVLVNAMLVAIWAMTSHGFFWPAFVMGFWGIGLVMNGYAAYHGNRITEEKIEREMRNLP
jgi:uncharacterized ion transporter superfamily protein YfcC